MPFDDYGKAIQEFLNGSIEAMAMQLWAFIQSAFSYSDMDSHWWISVVGGTITTKVGGSETEFTHPGMLNILVQALIPVLVIFVVFQFIMSMWKRSTAGMIRAVYGAFLAIPTTYIVTGILFTTIKIFDWITGWILNLGPSKSGSTGEDQAMAGILSLFGLSWDAGTKTVVLDENYQMWSAAKDPEATGGSLMGLILMLLIFACGLFLLIMMEFRTYGLVVLASFVPLATFALTIEAAKQIFGRWASVVLGLLIAKPAAAAFIMIGMTVSSTGDDAEQYAAGLIALVVGACMPLVAGSFVFFVNGGAHRDTESGIVNSVNRAGGSVSRGAGNVRRMIIRR